MWVVLIASYLVGTFPSAELVARNKGLDIRHEGSGNPGASNITRMLGWRWGVTVMLLDAGKGAIAAAMGWSLGGRPWGYAAVAAAVVGHMFPVWRRFRGGKGVATAGGGIAVLSPIVVVVLAPLWWLISRFSGKASLASLTIVILGPLGVWLVTGQGWEGAATAAIAALVATRHTDNVRRLVSRSEPSLSSNAHPESGPAPPER